LLRFTVNFNSGTCNSSYTPSYFTAHHLYIYLVNHTHNSYRLAVPLSRRWFHAAVQCDESQRVTEAETPSTQHRAREAGPQAHTSSRHPGMDAPATDCRQTFIHSMKVKLCNGPVAPNSGNMLIYDLD